MVSKSLIAITVMLLLLVASTFLYVERDERVYLGGNHGEFYPLKSSPKSFEDLFFPHWIENCTLSLKVPEYMHHFKLAYATTWAKYYQYGYETGRDAKITITDNYGDVYLTANNSAYGLPVGGCRPVSWVH